MPVTLSERATAHLRQLLIEHGKQPDVGLRISVEKGGCSGLQYVMRIAGPEPGDIVVSEGGARVFVASDSVSTLAGCVIDYHDSLSSSGFKVFNPNALRTCGCGTSFEAASSSKF